MCTRFPVHKRHEHVASASCDRLRRMVHLAQEEDGGSLAHAVDACNVLKVGAAAFEGAVGTELQHQREERSVDVPIEPYVWQCRASNQAW